MNLNPPTATLSIPMAPAARRILAAMVPPRAEMRSARRRLGWPLPDVDSASLVNIRNAQLAAAIERARLARDRLGQYDDAQAANLEAVLAASVAAGE